MPYGCIVCGMEKTAKDVFVTVRMRRELHAQLKTLARANERELAGEIRLALYHHLEQTTKEAA